MPSLAFSCLVCRFLVTVMVSWYLVYTVVCEHAFCVVRVQCLVTVMVSWYLVYTVVCEHAFCVVRATGRLTYVFDRVNFDILTA